MKTLPVAQAKALWMKENLRDGEVYAGLLLGEDGRADYHLIVMVGERVLCSWQEATDWAASIGGQLPNRREQRLLLVNARAAFRPEWYWSSEEYTPDSPTVWGQDFFSGGQTTSGRHYLGRARAVRRIYL